MTSLQATAGVWQAETSKMGSRGKLVIIQMGMFAAFHRTQILIKSNSKLHHWFLHIKLAHISVLLRPQRRRLEIPPRLSTLLHSLHLRHVPVSPRFSSSSHPQRKT
jgi:hypothetical protein